MTGVMRSRDVMNDCSVMRSQDVMNDWCNEVTGCNE